MFIKWSHRILVWNKGIQNTLLCLFRIFLQYTKLHLAQFFISIASFSDCRRYRIVWRAANLLKELSVFRCHPRALVILRLMVGVSGRRSCHCSHGCGLHSLHWLLLLLLWRYVILVLLTLTEFGGCLTRCWWFSWTQLARWFLMIYFGATRTMTHWELLLL